MALVYTLANQKGGVGKTTTAVNLGAYLAASGRRALLIDLDPQANATSSLGVDKNEVETSVYDVLVRDAPIGDALKLSQTSCFSLPGFLKLQGFFCLASFFGLPGLTLFLALSILGCLALRSGSGLCASSGLFLATPTGRFLCG